MNHPGTKDETFVAVPDHARELDEAICVLMHLTQPLLDNSAGGMLCTNRKVVRIGTRSGFRHMRLHIFQPIGNQGNQHHHTQWTALYNTIVWGEGLGIGTFKTEVLDVSSVEALHGAQNVVVSASLTHDLQSKGDRNGIKTLAKII